ncbi:unnamed protein product [Discosporangium mesarthrocarpum]
MPPWWPSGLSLQTLHPHGSRQDLWAPQGMANTFIIVSYGAGTLLGYGVGALDFSHLPGIPDGAFWKVAIGFWGAALFLIVTALVATAQVYPNPNPTLCSAVKRNSEEYQIMRNEHHPHESRQRQLSHDIYCQFDKQAATLERDASAKQHHSSLEKDGEGGAEHAFPPTPQHHGHPRVVQEDHYQQGVVPMEELCQEEAVPLQWDQEEGLGLGLGGRHGEFESLTGEGGGAVVEGCGKGDGGSSKGAGKTAQSFKVRLLEMALFWDVPRWLCPVCTVLFLSWVGWYAVIMFGSDWVGVDVFGGSPNGRDGGGGDGGDKMYEDGVSWASLGLAIQAAVVMAMGLGPMTYLLRYAGLRGGFLVAVGLQAVLTLGAVFVRPGPTG